MAIKNVGVIGCGLMGAGIVQTAAASKFPVVCVEAEQRFLDAGRARITAQLARAVEKGKLPAAERDAQLARATFTTDLEAIAGCDLVIEAVTENPAVKKDLFTRLDAVARPGAILATNTSSIPVIQLAAVTKRPAQVCGMHFFNPVPVMKLVEIIRTLATDDATIEAVTAFGRALGKHPVQAKDTPGFIVNRLLIPYLLSAIRLHENGVASREDIDEAMRLGCGYPMGPFRLADFVGLDTTLFAAEVIHREYPGADTAIPPMLRRLVEAGRLGDKTGIGFYTPAEKGLKG